MKLIEQTVERLIGETDIGKIETELRRFAITLLRQAMRSVKRRPTKPRHYRRTPTNRTATSDDAVDSIRPHKQRIRDRIYDHVVSCDAGATADEIEVALGMPGNTIRPRLRELEAARRVCRNRDVRKTRSGRSAFVWHARRGGAR